MGLPTFNSGDVLTAVNQTTVARQTVISTSSFVSSPTLGMVNYRTDLDLNFQWDGGDWRSFPKGVVSKTSIAATGPPITTSRVAVNNSSNTFAGITTTDELYAYELDLGIVGDASAATSYATVYVQLDGTDIDIDRHIYIPVGLVTNMTHIRVVTAVTTDANHTFSCEVKLTGGGYCSIYGGTDATVTHIGTRP